LCIRCKRDSLMKCPKCNGSCRLKMTGAVCLDCDWYTHDRNKVRESSIDKKFLEEHINDLSEEQEEMGGEW